jgi:hypothetical protein
VADINCAWCNEPWDVQELRDFGIECITSDQADQMGIGKQFEEWTSSGYKQDHWNYHAVSQEVYREVLRGHGCPSQDCGFGRTGEGPHRAAQMRALVIDGVTDDDPMEFL